MDTLTQVHRALCPGFAHYGRTLDALNDALRGGLDVTTPRALQHGERARIVLLRSRMLPAEALAVFASWA